MKINKSLLGLIMVTILLSGCVVYIIDPGEITANNNGTFTVDIVLDQCVPIPFTRKFMCTDTNDVYGVAFDLNYDSNVINFQSIDVSGGVLANVTATTGFRNSPTDNGKLVVGISKQGRVPGEQGQGKVATITFKAVSAGNTTLTFVDPHLVDSTGKFLVGWPLYAASLKQASVTIAP